MANHRSSLKRVARCAPLILMAACAAEIDGYTDEDAVDAKQQAIVYRGINNPPLRTTVSGVIPPLFPGRSDPTTGGVALLNIPSDFHRVPYSNATTWLNDATTRTDTSAAVFRSRLEDALAVGETVRKDREKIDWTDVANGVFDLAGIPVDIDPGSPVKRVFGHLPEQARWLDRENVGDLLTTFPDPPKTHEIRLRGALAYCAAKQAYLLGGDQTKIMGRKPLLEFNVLGKKIGVLTVEPTVALGAPKKSALSNTNDGAQAFTIPLSVGVRVAPLSLLPTLPELRTPVNYVTGDSEVLTQSNVNANLKRWWQTVTHADMFVTSARVGKIDMDPVTIFTVGPLAVQLEADFDLHTQTCSRGLGEKVYDSCAGNPHQRVTRLFPVSLFGIEGRTGRSAGMIGEALHNDAFWTFANGANGTLDGLVGGDTNARVFDIGADPLQPRVLLDNDKAIEVRTGAYARLRLSAGGVADLYGLSIEVTAGGILEGNVDVVHVIRDQVIATRRPLAPPSDEFNLWKPETSISVTPRTEASLGGGFNIQVAFIVDLPLIGRTKIGGPVVHYDMPRSSIQSQDWAEENRLRIGTDTSWTPATRLVSHFPKQRDETAPPTIGSFSEGMTSCLTSASPSGTMSPPCDSVVGEYPSNFTSTAPAAKVCVIGQNHLPDWDIVYPADRCKIRLASFVAGGASKPHSAHSGSSRSRTITGTADANLFKAVLAECANAGLSVDTINTIVTVGLCDNTGAGFVKPLSVTRDPVDGSELTPNRCR